MKMCLSWLLVFFFSWHVEKWGRTAVLKCLLNKAKCQFYTVWSREHQDSAASFPSERNHLHKRTLPRQQSPNKQRSLQPRGVYSEVCFERVPNTSHMRARCERSRHAGLENKHPISWAVVGGGVRGVCGGGTLHIYFDVTVWLMLL